MLCYGTRSLYSEEARKCVQSMKDSKALLEKTSNREETVVTRSPTRPAAARMPLSKNGETISLVIIGYLIHLFISSYYGRNYERLLAAKRFWDPDNVFELCQGVGSTEQDCCVED